MEYGVTREYPLTATLESLDDVLAFIKEGLAGTGCSQEDQALIFIAAEEIYVNIAHYAYGEAKGPAIVRTTIRENPLRLVLEFEDGGVPYNPLDKEDPDITLDAEARSVGGLGIFMVKEIMDALCYRYERGKNILTMEKHLSVEDRGSAVG